MDNREPHLNQARTPTSITPLDRRISNFDFRNPQQAPRIRQPQIRSNNMERHMVPVPFGRRQLLTSLGAAVAAAAVPELAFAASDYPTRAIRWVSASPAGSGGDVIARLVSNEVAKVLGQSIVIDNKPGADGIIAAQAVATAKPDGYTFLFNYTSHVTNPSLRSQPFDSVKDFTPISMVSTNWTILLVRGDSPVRTVADLIAAAKKKPGELSVGFLPGSVTHMAAELLFSETDMDVLRVPYKANNDAVKDLMGGGWTSSSARTHRCRARSKVASCALWRSPIPGDRICFPTYRRWPKRYPASTSRGGTVSWAPRGCPPSLSTR